MAGMLHMRKWRKARIVLGTFAAVLLGASPARSSRAA
jgi:hypothetical protein